jgi:hypothetical protein
MIIPRTINMTDIQVSVLTDSLLLFWGKGTLKSEEREKLSLDILCFQLACYCWTFGRCLSKSYRSCQVDFGTGLEM